MSFVESIILLVHLPSLLGQVLLDNFEASASSLLDGSRDELDLHICLLLKWGAVVKHC